MTTTREAALEAALTLARNRLQACAIDHPTGSREMYERSEWADEATAALSTPSTEPQGYVEGLEAAASKLQNVADNWDCGHNESRLCDCAPYVEQWGLAADEIRAMITLAQHDALAAHVAAEVAKARAEDTAKIASIPPLVSTLIQFINALADECDADLDDVVATVRIMPEGREVVEVSATVVIEKLQAALSQIGAKP